MRSQAEPVNESMGFSLSRLLALRRRRGQESRLLAQQQGEDLDYIEKELGIGVKNGEHRRNIITRGIRLGDLRRKKFRVGETVLEYDRPRPPCRHVQDLSEPGMTRALKGRGGICARVVQAGSIRVEDAIETA